MRKDIVTIFIGILTLLVNIPVYAYDFTDDGIYFDLKSDGSLEVTGLASWTTRADILSDVTINGKTYRVTSIGEYAFQDRSDITYISIPWSVTSIGEYAFIDCGSNMTVNIADPESWCQMKLGNEHSSPLSSAGRVLVHDIETTNIVIPTSVTSIGNFTFYQCRCITSLYIPNSVTSIGSSAFEDCTGLTSVTLSEGLSSIGGSSFEGCKGITSITIPSTVSSISINAFKNCTSLNTITSEIQNPFAIDESVFSTYSYATLYVPQGTKKAYQSTTGWNMFENIVAPKEGSEIGEIFKSGDIYYIVGENNTVSVTQGEVKYSGDVVIPNQVTYNGNTYSVTTIGYCAFESCTGLLSVTIPPSIKSIDIDAFKNCRNMIAVNISDITSWCNIIFVDNYSNPLYYAHHLFLNGTKITTLNIPKSISRIKSYTFQGCSDLTSVTISDNITSIGDYAFGDCNNLNTVILEIMNPFRIDESTFASTNSEKDIYASAILVVPEGTKAAYQATEGWNKFSQITDGTTDTEFTKGDITYSITSVSTVEVISVSNSLKRVIIPESVSNNGTTYKVTTLAERSFEGRDDITYLSIPSSIKSIGEYAFMDCGSNFEVNIKSLEAWCDVKFGNQHSSPLSSAKAFYLNDVEVKSLSIPNGVTSIPSYAFYQCRSISSLSIPSTVISVGSSAFEDCTGLKSITLSKGLTSVGGSSFEGCTGITSITLPSTVSSIALNAFSGCTNLNNIISEILQPFAIDENVFSTYTTATLSVPAGTKSAYQSTAGWYMFRNITDGQDVILTANSYTREYGDPNPVFDYTREGDELIGTPSIICDATATSPVGVYTIRITKGSVANSNVSYVDGTLTITKAPLSITAKSYSREQGQENPDFEVTYGGFKNGEDENVLTIKPTVSTTATSSSSPGTYDIIVSSAEAQNYSISYNKGVLTVTEKDEIAFTIDGTTYQGNKTAKTVVVKSVDKGLMSVEIPASVSNDGITYQVTGIDNDALKGSSIAALIWNVETALPSIVFSNSSIGSNFLLYVKVDSYAPSSVKNVVVDGTAQSILLSDDGGQFYSPKAFTARSISYTHNYSMETGGDGKGWETIALPFDVQRISHSKNGEIVPFASYSSSSDQKPFWLANFSGSSFRRASAIKANEPYIIAMPNSSKYNSTYILAGDVSFSAENVQVTKTPSFSGLFVPTFATVARSSTVHALNVNNQYVKYSGSYEAGSHFISDLRDIRPFEAYISENSTRGIIKINFDDYTTEMNQILISPNEGQKVIIYTLSGQQVASSNQCNIELLWNDLPKGVYIVNGKKLIK